MFKAALDEIAPDRVPAPLHRIKLNQNENPCELPARLRARILARMKEAAWSRYPDFPPAGLRRRLARHTGRPEAEILIGHGSNELILSAALATLSRGSGVVLAEPGFALFERVATLCEAAIRRVRLNEDLSFPVDRLQSEAARPDTALVLLASPNNPTGSVLSSGAIAQIAGGTRALVLLDEAYHEFAAADHLRLLSELPHLVITRTFSKACAMAGLRLGYALGAPETIARLEAATLPFSIDLGAQIAGEEVIDHFDLIRPAVAGVIRRRARLQRALGRFGQIRAYPSEANFILVRFPDARAAWEGLLARGILVRDVSSQPGLGGCLRITVGSAQENAQLVQALTEMLT